MARVCRPGGRIGLANWTPEGFIGQLFKMLGRHVPPPAGRAAAVAVGHRGAPARRCSATRAAAIAVTPRMFNFRYRSAAHFIDVFRTWYGPVHKAFAALPAEQARGARARPDRAARTARTAPAPDRWSCPSEYLEVVVTRALSAWSARLQRRVQRYGWDLAAPRLRAAVAGAAGAGAARAAGARRRCAPGERVLDVACGTGLVAFAAAAAVGAGGQRARRRPVRRDGRRGAPACRARTVSANAAFARMDAESARPAATPASTSRCARSASCTCPIPRGRCARCAASLRPGGRVGARRLGRARALRLVAGVPDRRRRSRERCLPAVLPPRQRRCAGAPVRRRRLRRRSTQQRIATTLAYADGDEACDAALRRRPGRARLVALRRGDARSAFAPATWPRSRRGGRRRRLSDPRRVRRRASRARRAQAAPTAPTARTLPTPSIAPIRPSDRRARRCCRTASRVAPIAPAATPRRSRSHQRAHRTDAEGQPIAVVERGDLAGAARARIPV